VAETRLRAASIVLFLILAGAAVVVLGATYGPWGVAPATPLPRVALWAGLIAAAHLTSVPTPSGHRINLGIGPAVAAAVLLDDPAALAAAYAVGMALAWVVLQLRTLRQGRRDGDFVAETLAMAIFGIVFSVALGPLARAFPPDWAFLVAATTGGLAWFIMRAVVAALVGIEREDLSPRYLWLLTLEDWQVVVSLFTAGVFFGLAWPPMGLWAFAVAVLPYVFSHVAFERYDSTRITYGQTIRALAQIPEVAGLADQGHSYRTAELAVAVARDLGLHPNDVIDLEYAALMHDVGRITLNEPAILEAGYTDEDIARWGAQIIAEAPYLGRVSRLVAQQHLPYRSPGVARDPDVPMAAKIIKVASAYDQGVHERRLSPMEALERIHQGSAYEFDPKVAASLRRVLVHRGDVPV